MSNIYLLSCLGLLMVVLSIPLILRRVPPNPLYGLRVPATYKDDQVWYDANAATGRDMAIAGLVIALTPVLLSVLGVRDFWFSILWAAIVGVGVTVASVLGWTRANRMLRERQAGRG